MQSESSSRFPHQQNYNISINASRFFEERTETNAENHFSEFGRDLLISMQNKLDNLNLKPLEFVQPFLPEYSLLNLAVKVGKAEIVSLLIDNKSSALNLDCTDTTPFERALLKQACSFVYANQMREDDKIRKHSVDELYVPDKWEYSIKAAIEGKEVDEVNISNNVRYKQLKHLQIF